MLFALLLASSGVLLGRAATLSTSTTPVFFWSGAQHLKGKQSISGIAPATEVESYVRDIVSTNAERVLHPEHVSAKNPEVFVSFTYKKTPYKFMADVAGSFDAKQPSFLKDSFNNAPSSLILTKVSLERKYSSFVSMFSVHLAPKAQMIEYTIEDSESCEKVIEDLSQKNVFKNKNTDLLSIVFIENNKQSSESCMQLISSVVSEHTVGDFVCMLSADSVEPIQVAFPTVSGHSNSLHQSHHDLHTQDFVSATNTQLPAGTGIIEYITPVIFIGIIFGLMLIYFFYVGVAAMISIVVPMRFEKSPFKLGKIY